MIKVNLNKKQKNIKIKFETGGLLPYFIAPLVLAAIAVFLLQYSMDRKINDLNNNIKIYNNKTTEIMPRVRMVNEIKAKISRITQKINAINTLKKEQIGPIGYIYRLTASIPRFSWINSLKSNNGNLTIDGIALDGQVVSLFMDNLNDSGFFSNVSLVQTTEVKKEGLRLQNFSLTMKVKSNAISMNKK